MTSRLGRSVTTSEVAQEMGITSQEIRKYLQMTKKTMSLDVRVGKSEDTELSELVEDESPSLEHQLIQGLMREEVLKMLAELKSKERDVLLLRFGLEDGTEWTLQAIAVRLNLSRERVRQIESKALTKLKAKKLKALRDYLAG